MVKTCPMLQRLTPCQYQGVLLRYNRRSFGIACPAKKKKQAFGQQGLGVLPGTEADADMAEAYRAFESALGGSPVQVPHRSRLLRTVSPQQSRQSSSGAPKGGQRREVQEIDEDAYRKFEAVLEGGLKRPGDSTPRTLLKAKNKALAANGERSRRQALMELMESTLAPRTGTSGFPYELDLDLIEPAGRRPAAEVPQLVAPRGKTMQPPGQRSAPAPSAAAATPATPPRLPKLASKPGISPSQASEAFGEAMADAVSRMPYWATVPAAREATLVPETPKVPVQAPPPPPALPKPQKPLPKRVEQLQDEVMAQKEEQQHEPVSSVSASELAPLPVAGEPDQGLLAPAWAQQSAPASPAAQPPPLRKAPARPAGTPAPASGAQTAEVAAPAEQPAEHSEPVSGTTVHLADQKPAQHQSATPETAEAAPDAAAAALGVPDALPAEPAQGAPPTPGGDAPAPPALPRPVPAARPRRPVATPEAVTPPEDNISRADVAPDSSAAGARPITELAAAAEGAPDGAAAMVQQAGRLEEREEVEVHVEEEPEGPVLAAPPPPLRPSPVPPQLQPPSAPSLAMDQPAAPGRGRSAEEWFQLAQMAANSQAVLGGSIIKANRGGLIVRLDNGLGGFLPAKRMAWERRAALAQQQAKLQGAAPEQDAGGSAAPTMPPHDLRRQALASFVGSSIQVYITAAEVVPSKGPGPSRPICQVFLSEERPGTEPRALSAVPPDIIEALQHSVGEPVQAHVQSITKYGAFLAFDVEAESGAVSTVYGLMHKRSAGPGGVQALLEGQLVEAFIESVDIRAGRVFLAAKERPLPLARLQQTIEDLMTTSSAELPGTQEAQAGEVLPEVQQFCDRLRRLGYIQSVTPGRRLQGSAYASDFQVFMSKQQGEVEEAALGKDDLNRYTLLARVRNEVQEVRVCSSLDREDMKQALALTLAGGA